MVQINCRKCGKPMEKDYFPDGEKPMWCQDCKDKYRTERQAPKS